MKALLTTGMLALSLGPAVAVCLSHEPLRPTMHCQDFLDPYQHLSQFYIRTPRDRDRRRSVLCTAPGFGAADRPLAGAQPRCSTALPPAADAMERSIPDGRIDGFTDSLDRLQRRCSIGANFNCARAMISVVAAAMSGVLDASLVLITGKNLMFGELPIGEAVTRGVRALVVSALLIVEHIQHLRRDFFTQTFRNQLASRDKRRRSAGGAPAFDAMSMR